MAVLAACAGWALVSAGANGGRAEGVLLAVLAVAAGYAAGRMSGALLPVAAPCAVALAGLVLTVAAPELSPGPESAAPLGRAGAEAAVLTLVAGLACCAAWASPAAPLRLALRLLAALAAVTGAALGSVAAVVTCCGVLLASLAAGRAGRGVGVAGLALATASLTALTWAVAAGAPRGGLAEVLDGQLTPRRIALWREALHLAETRPGLGAGPGSFAELSATAAQSPLSDGRPHSAPLQLAAEQGVVGVLLLAAAFAWLLHALWRSPRPTPVALTAGACLTALAALALVGNVLSFTTVTAGAGLLAGIATASPLPQEAREPDGMVRAYEEDVAE
ncbi:O-antigen ligase family protein [Streptomyces niveiscabiei]|uniref:O-antigen ligase family protein n=1 Tax=Streptomyces niveiscabiei TaxID=164115 RepID=UPI0029B5D825|nr:O-antigen ligase family protein [Streptomyces niveiscabiei]MDX3384262.1 O-antigen ligase family protein [Streptomyces niveiscabiei]